MVFFFWRMLEMYYLENIVLTEHKLRCPAIPSQKRVLNQIQVRSVIELKSFNSHLQLLFISLLTTKRRHLDCDKVNPGAHDKGSWWIIRLFLLLVVRFCASFAGVASISNRFIAWKLERQEIRGFLFSPFPPVLFLTSFLISSQHSLRTPTETLATQAIWLFVFLFFLSFLLFFNVFFTQ